MKRVLAIVLGLCLLSGLSVNADIDTIEGSTIAGGGCTCGTVDETIAATADSNQSTSAAAHGMSISPSTTINNVCGLNIYYGYVGSDSVHTLRFGTSSDLTSYDEEVGSGTIDSGADDTYHTYEFSTTYTLSSGSTYYWGITEDSGDARLRDLDPGDWGDGQHFYSVGSDWDMESSDTADIRFQILVCD
jgi:hypothetical protein